MHRDFGYMEEGKLGKPYNLRLLKRLAGYAIPYKKTVFVCLLLAIFIAMLNLVLPYFSKIAIDRYILSSWYSVNLSMMQKDDLRDFLKNYGHLTKGDESGSYALIPNSDVKKIDPADLYRYRSQGVIPYERLYKAWIDDRDIALLMEDGEGFLIKMKDGSIALPIENLKQLEPKDILRIRAEDFRGLTFVGIALLCVLLSSLLLGYWENYLLEFIGQNIMLDIRLNLFQRIQSRAFSFFNRHPVGQLVTRVTNDIENLNEMFKSVLVTFFKDIFILTGIIAVLIYLNWRLAIVSFMILPLIFGFTMLFSSLMREAFRELREKVSKLNSFQQERFAGMRIIQLFAREKYQMDNFAGLNHENYLAGMKQLRLFAIFVPVMELISSLAVALIIWYGGGKVISDQLSLGSLVAFISYIQMFFRPIREISEKYNIMQLAMASTERIFEFMDNGEEVLDPENPEHLEKSDGHLEFKDISFSYEKGRPVLNDLSFEIKSGEMVAVVGATGAGKTTLVNLIERFYDPDKGVISLDGVDIRKLSKKDLRSGIALVMQDVFIFSGTVMENISLGREDLGTETIGQAVSDANAQWFIEKLPNGFYQKISEGGSTLSGGERQLLSFARALAYEPKVLILDEATSSVDPETERFIQDAITRMTRNRTTLVIAHRLSTIRKADRIIVMHHGRICEQGTHEDLMETGGVYYKLNKFKEYSRVKESL
ncbi:ABC transporter ATP-binding protein/permease [Deltaproteobacteria bacterium]|nr:ABC transporter ATP-binding protein/permease [Deltaproteobacteria bacterium]